MNLTPTELERLTIFTAAEMARRYHSQNIRLSHPEAIALICDEIMTAARRGLSHPDLVSFGRTILSEDDVLPGVRAMLRLVSVEVGMTEGTKLITVFDPISPGKAEPEETIIPGEIITYEGEIEVNAGRQSVSVDVLNTGDRTIQVRSHAHFFEVNRALAFDRIKAYGMRLDVPSGVGARFDPGVPKTVRLVSYAGRRIVNGFGGLTNGSLDEAKVKESAISRAGAKGYLKEVNT